MTTKFQPRPFGVTALGLFFLCGAAISFTVFVSLLFPGSFLEPIWRLNPRAHQAFARVGAWAIILMAVVCLSCALAALGLWRGARWGYRVSLALLVLNMLGDILNVILGTEPGAIVGVPIVVSLLTYLMSRRVRRFFRRDSHA
ncbi:MAG TPA: hypothetical protein VF779_19300 [Pyrinomonadaceae bacterium]